MSAYRMIGVVHRECTVHTYAVVKPRRTNSRGVDGPVVWPHDNTHYINSVLTVASAAQRVNPYPSLHPEALSGERVVYPVNSVSVLGK